MSTHAHSDQTLASVKDTITSIVIAFTMAFVFRGFVVEAFVIPTGSMAPTLMGAHMRFQGPDSGYQWQVGPWHYGPGGRPWPIQAPSSIIARGGTDARGVRVSAIEVADPMIGQRLSGPMTRDVRCLSGDRIFVLKYLPPFFDAARWDVAVFKNPTAPQENFIKRLVGLPGEQVALVDGDVFVREASDGSSAGWDEAGWRIARKDERTQRAVWQPVFDSGHEPFNPGAIYTRPWRGSAGAWSFEPRRYRLDAPGSAVLDWDADARRTSPFPGRIPAQVATWAVHDFYPYNENPGSALGGVDVFPVSDVRLSFGIEPDRGARVGVTGELRARGHVFEGAVEPSPDGRGSVAVLRMRRQGNDGAWTELAREPLRHGLRHGRVTNLELWHADQALSLWIDGTRVAEGVYDWSPAERIARATGRPFQRLLSEDRARSYGLLRDPSVYERPSARWRFEAEGGGLTLHRVRVDRDIHYQSGAYRPVGGHPLAGEPMVATHPTQNTLVLTQDQYFTLGDNSPASSDGRAWDEPDPWIATLIDPTPGVVHRRLMIGKAFFVYFPAPYSVANRAVLPDFGRLRFIW